MKTKTNRDTMFSQFCVERLVFGETLVVPLMVVYREFRKFIAPKEISVGKVRDYLTDCGVELKIKGKGKLKTVALGVGVKNRQEEKPRSPVRNTVGKR